MQGELHEGITTVKVFYPLKMEKKKKKQTHTNAKLIAKLRTREKIKAF